MAKIDISNSNYADIARLLRIRIKSLKFNPVRGLGASGNNPADPVWPLFQLAEVMMMMIDDDDDD